MDVNKDEDKYSGNKVCDIDCPEKEEAFFERQKGS
jgi:hypothetical protein